MALLEEALAEAERILLRRTPTPNGCGNRL
jgi:hypothetical protein